MNAEVIGFIGGFVIGWLLRSWYRRPPSDPDPDHATFPLHNGGIRPKPKMPRPDIAPRPQMPAVEIHRDG